MGHPGWHAISGPMPHPSRVTTQLPDTINNVYILPGTNGRFTAYKSPPPRIEGGKSNRMFLHKGEPRKKNKNSALVLGGGHFIYSLLGNLRKVSGRITNMQIKSIVYIRKKKNFAIRKIWMNPNYNSNQLKTNLK